MTSAALVIAPIAVPSAPAAPVFVTKSCARPECTAKFVEGSGFIPELKTLYRMVRGTDVLKSRPLLHDEIVARELCGSCRKLASYRTFPSGATINLMKRWIESNADYLSRQAARRFAEQHSHDELTHLSDAERLKKHSMLSFVEAKAVSDAKVRHKKGRRLPAAMRREKALNPRHFDPTPKKDKKKNEGRSGRRNR